MDVHSVTNSEMVIWSKPDDRKVTGLRHFVATRPARDLLTVLLLETTKSRRCSCACRAPVTTETNGRQQTSTDFHGLSVAV
jgi:hypothetical protein